MKKVTIRESQAPYTLAIDAESLGEETFILERDGRPVAAVAAITQYEALQAWQQAETRRNRRQSQIVAFQQERAAFERMLPELIRTYPGQVVGIYQGEIAEVGTDIAAVREQIYDRFGYVPCYVQLIEETPHIYKFPHRKVKLSSFQMIMP